MNKHSFDPCNGYVRSCCDKCIFYECYSDHPATYHICKFNPAANDYHGGHLMRWVSAFDCSHFPEMSYFHYEACLAYSPKNHVVDQLRSLILGRLGYE